jgi:glycosyltransferase involved in cell wall biosynthesis
MPRVLVVAHAAVNLPHRKPYDLLGRQPGWEIHIAVPTQVKFGNGKAMECQPAPPGSGYQLHQLPVHFVESGRLVYFRGLAPLIIKLRPDVVYAEYDPGSLPILHACVAARSVGAKVIAFTVENIFRDRVKDVLDDVRGLAPRAVARDALVAGLDRLGRYATDSLVSISAEASDIYTGHGWAKPASVVPLGTDLSLFKPQDSKALRQRLGLGDAFVVGYFGRLVPEKGIHFLIESLPLLPPNTRLLLDLYEKFAPGSYADSLMRRASELGVRERIVTIDVPHEAVPENMSCCDVLVLPSLSTPRWKEQFGRVLPEAMACGVPVIGSSSGNIPSVVGDAGLIFAEGSVPELVEAIRKLINDPALGRKLAKRGERRVRELFSVDVQVRALADVFNGRPSRTDHLASA